MPTFLTLLLLAGAAAGLQPETPQWPLDLGTRYLTGNFMEPRGGRFHTGLDLKTNSRTGYAVLAAETGWISRVKMRPNGYGKAVYLSTPDGTTYVYGHLGRLADGLRARVRAVQQRRGRYAVDLHFARGEWPVVRGQVLALSGQSGTSGPHLHFEVRGSDGAPRDPQAHGFAVHDALPPTLLAVRALLGGTQGSVVLTRTVSGAGTLPALTAPGVGELWIRLVEHADHLRYRLWPCTVRVSADGEVVYEARNDALAWAHNRQQRIEFRDTEDGRELRVTPDPDVDLAGRRGRSDWARQLADGAHEVRIELIDRAGNRTVAVLPLVIDGAARPDTSAWRRSPVDRRWPSLLAGGVTQPGTDGPIRRVGSLGVPPRRERLRLAGLERLGPACEIAHAARPIVDPVTVALPGTCLAGRRASDPRLGLYRIDADGNWEWEAALPAPDSATSVTVDAAGAYLVLRDAAPPVIASAAVATRIERRGARRDHGISQPRWPVLRVPVGDHGSGIDWESLRVRLDDRPLVVEPDAPRDRILVELPDGLEAGPHRLAVSVADRAGLEARAVLELDLRDHAEPETPPGR